MTRRPPDRFRLRPMEILDLPRLAWGADVDLSTGEVTVRHGRGVECRDDWVVEGVWDGKFAAGDFHRSEHFFGSGIRLEGASVYFVPSGALVDRLLYCHTGGRLLVSNSLSLLLATTGARLDPRHDYRIEGHAIRRGVAAYEPDFVVSHPDIPAFQQLFDECLVVTGTRLDRVATRTTPGLASYAEYRSRVAHALGLLANNARSPARRAPLSLFATISSGYDSAAAAALVRDLDIAACFTSRRSNSHWPGWLRRQAAIDDGRPIAARLGLHTRYLDARLSRIDADAELLFLGGNCAQAALVFHSMAAELAAVPGGAVLFTGFLGDDIWEETWERAYHGVGIIRGDTTGLTLGEIRLASGFIDVPVPSLCARRIEDVAALTDAPEMDPWRLGIEYDRPIPRRILEEAGVPRHAFARRKKAVVGLRTYPAHRGLRRDFWRWLRTTQGVSPGGAYFQTWMGRASFYGLRPYYLLRRWMTGASPPETPTGIVARQRDFARWLFVWAANTLSDRVAAVLAAPPPAPRGEPQPVSPHV